MKALIVGGSSGIGAACRKLLDDRGWSIETLDRTSGVDIVDHITYPRTLAACLADRPDLVIYSAGHVDPRPLAEIDLADWRRTLEVNLTGAFRVVQQVAVRPWQCTLVLIASTAGTRPSPGWAAYAASKAALINLGETAHAELGPLVRVYVLTPGRCATPLRAILAPGENPATIMQPAEVAATIATLHDDDTSGVLCGAPIRVAGS